MKRSLPVYLFSLLSLSALALLGPGSSRPAGAQGRSLALVSLLAPPVVPSSYNITDLGTLGGAYSVPNAINASGQVAGNSLTTGNAAVHAFLWNNGKMQDLGTLGGANSAALAINASGQVVGNSTTLAEAVAGGSTVIHHAFLWENGAMKDLNSMLPAGSGWFVFGVLAINDAGQIVGNGIFNGQERACLLTPAR
jgi:probable HAF family extracellular repeat protein